VEARFSSFEDSSNLDARYVHGLHQTYHRLKNRFWMHWMEQLGKVGLMESLFGPFGDNISVDAR
jgi:hypothetical protein